MNFYNNTKLIKEMVHKKSPNIAVQTFKIYLILIYLQNFSVLFLNQCPCQQKEK